MLHSAKGGMRFMFMYGERTAQWSYVLTWTKSKDRFLIDVILLDVIYE